MKTSKTKDSCGEWSKRECERGERMNPPMICGAAGPNNHHAKIKTKNDKNI